MASVSDSAPELTPLVLIITQGAVSSMVNYSIIVDWDG